MLGRTRSPFLSWARTRLRAGPLVAGCLALCLAGWLTGVAAGPTGGWVELASLPAGIAQASAVALPDGRIVVTGGYSTSGKETNAIEVFDPKTNEWSSPATLKNARRLHASALGSDNKVYVFGGTVNSKPISSVESFDPATDTAALVTDSNCLARYGQAAVTLGDGTIMLIGGSGDQGRTNAVEFFDVEASKCTLATGDEVMPTARTYLSAVRGTDGRVFAIGGFGGNDNQSLDVVEIYDPSSGTWSTGAPMPEPRLRAAAVNGPDGMIYVIGGEDLTTKPTTYYDTVLRYDPATDSWDTLPGTFDLPAARSQLAAVATSDQVVAIGGFEEGSAASNLRKNVYGLAFDVTPPDTTPPTTSITVEGPHHNDDWFTGQVTVTLSASGNDGGSGVKEIDYILDGGQQQIYSDAFTVDGDGSHTVGFWSVDNTGNKETTQSRTIKIDKTAPTISAVVQDGNGDVVEPKSGDWFTGPLTITFTCADETSGIDSSDPTACQGTSQLEDGQNQSISGTARDEAGNTTPFNIDGINVGDPRPLVDYVLQDGNNVEIAPNAAGWFNQPVTVHFRCTPVSGSIASCGPDKVLGEGSGQTVTGAAQDDQDHSRSVTTDKINIDLTPPAYSAEFLDSNGQTIVANPAGWFNQPVTVHVDCADALSGVVDCPADESYTDTTAGQLSATIHDTAGNETSILIGDINVDSAAPEVNCPTADTDWHADDVSFTCQASDDRSNISDTDASFTLTTSVPDGTETDQATTGSRTVCDLAGNCAGSVQITGVRVDKLAPALEIDSPAGSYLQGASVTASYNCNDGGSGIASCSGTAANDDPVDTSTTGDHSFSVTAVDGVGHQTTQTITYTVLEVPTDPGGDDPPVGSDAGRYQVQLLYDQDEAVTRGYWALIRISLWDTKLDRPAAPRLRVNAIDVSPAAATFKAPGNFSAHFQYSRKIGQHGGYQLALNTRKLAPGDYLLRFIVDGDDVVQQVAFSVR